MPPSVWTVAALCAVFVGRAWAQSGWKNQVNISMCNWGQLRANTIRDTVYLDGGSLWWQLGYSDDSTDLQNNNNNEGLLYSLNFSSKFDTSTTNLTGLFKTLSKAGGVANNIAPNYRDGVMFANDNEFYLYGGLLRLTDSQDSPAGNAALGYERYQYGPVRTSWKEGFISQNIDNDVTRYITHGAGVSAPSENLGFYFSGMRAQNWGPIYYNNQSANTSSDRMIKVDMSTMRDNKWSNLTLPEYVPPRANAEAVWIPVSESGALVVIGGVVNPESIFYSDGLTSSQQNASKEESPKFMETVSVYDIASDKWYIQETSGDTPPALTQFCSVYASASDGSSHNIYIYGGYDGLSPENKPSDDVYVLSLPSFSWIKLYSGNSTHGRSGHKCVKPYPNQMLVLGGVYLDATHCLEGGIIQTFNLNTGRFQNTYNPTEWSEYKVPDLVTGRIGGDAKGSAKKTSPDKWTNSSLADVFKTKYTKTINTWYPYKSTNSSTPTTPTPVPEKGSSFPAWAGAVIGVLLGLLVIAAAIAFWCIRRRRKARGSQHETVDSGNRSRVLRWMYLGGSGSEVPKSNETTASTGFTPFHPNESSVDQSVATARSPATIEAASAPVYEMHDQSTTPPVELPTPYNNNPFGAPSPVSSTSASDPGFRSPISPATPGSNDGESPTERPTHHRNVSSLSSVRSFSIANMMRGEGVSRHSQKPSVVSDVSETTVSSEGAGLESGMSAQEEYFRLRGGR